MSTTSGPGNSSYRQQVQRSIGFIGQNLDFFTQVKAQSILSIALRHLGNPAELVVLDVGCGEGLTDHCLASSFGSLYGVDTDESAVASAVEANPLAHYQVCDGKTLPFSSATFDLVFAINVMHHVSPSSRGEFMSQMCRVTKSGGLLAIFEHNPLNPLTRLAVSRCALDNDAALVGMNELKTMLMQADLSVIEQRYILFFPFRSYLAGKIEHCLGWLPLGAQQYVVARKR